MKESNREMLYILGPIVGTIIFIAFLFWLANLDDTIDDRHPQEYIIEESIPISKYFTPKGQ
jgi:hypothetical protein